MDGFDPATSFGPDVAQRYDDEPRGDEAETVELLASLVGDGPVLELAIGTGRIALPLAARGLRVDGIELSPDMLERLRDKEGGAKLAVVQGDMASADAPSSGYSLAYLVFNTIGNLLTQDAQVACFTNVTRHLADDGVFVVETATPWSFVRLTQFVDVERVATGEVVLDVNRYDPVTQLLDENHVTLTDAGVRMGPISCRLVTHAELDLMAQLAGLRLVDRWGGWRREPFTATSTRHVSVYGR